MDEAAAIAGGAGDTALRLALIGFLVLLNGFFVAAEFAIVRVRGNKVEALVNAGSRRAGVAKHILSHLDAYLSATQLGITIASILLGWVGEQTMRHHVVEPLLGMFGVTSESVLRATSFLFGMSIIVFLHVVLGELAPKTVAIRYPETTSLWVAYPMVAFYYLVWPLIAILNGTANSFLRMLGIQPAGEGELAHSEEELRLLLASSQRLGMITGDKRSLIENVFELSETIVRQIMVPRTEIAAFDLTRPLAENLRVAERTAHSRYPLMDGDLDRVVGVIHMKDLFWQLKEMEQGASAAMEDLNPKIAGGDVAHQPPPTGAAFLKQIAREVPFVPETMRIDALLREFQSRRVHLAMVVDEFGGISGMATFENVIEEIVGEVQDEFDEEAPLIRQLSGDEFLLDGVAGLFEVNQVLGTKLEAEDVDTVGGLILSELGRLPLPGEKVEFPGVELTVREVRRRRVHRVLALRVKPVKEGDEAETDEPDATTPPGRK